MTGQVAGRTASGCLKRDIMGERGLLTCLSDCTIFFRAESGSCSLAMGGIKKKKLCKSMKMSFSPSSTTMRGL